MNNLQNTNTYKGFLTNFAHYAYQMPIARLRGVQQTLNNALDQAQKINRSVIGNYLFSATKENILECVGAFSAAYFAEWLVKDSQGEINVYASTTIVTITTLGAGILIGRQIYHKTQNALSSHPIATKLGSVAIGTTVFALSQNALTRDPELTVRLGHQMGTLIISQIGSILGGFLAIKISGSHEVLINFNNPLDSYAVKSLQASVVCNSVNYLWSFNPLLQAIHDQTLGSLSYHSITVIKLTMKSIRQGTFLDNTLINVPLLTEDEKKIIIQEEMKKVMGHSSNQQGFLNLMRSHGIDPSLYLINIVFHDPNFFLEQLNTLQRCTPLDQKKLTGIVFRALAKYLDFLFDNVELKQAQYALTQAYIAHQPDPFLSPQYVQRKQELINLLEAKISQYTSTQSSMFKQTDLNMLTKINVNKLSDTFLSKLEQLEEKLFAYKLTSLNSRKYFHDFVNIHLKNYNNFLVLESSKPLKELELKTLRKNYQYLNQSLTNYYKMIFKAWLPKIGCYLPNTTLHIISRFLNSQLKTAQLRDATLSDMIEINTLHSYLNYP